VPAMMIIALVLAIMLNAKLPALKFFRSAYYLPSVISGVAVAMLWKWMFNGEYGLINAALARIGIDGPSWLTDENWALRALIFMSLWGFGGTMLIYLAGLQGVPKELYEAAKVDGASQFQRFRDITLPLLRTVIAIAVMLHTLWWWNHFDILLILGSGSGQFGYGTMTLPILAWFEAFRWSHLARGAAISVVSMAILAVVMIWNARRELRSVTS
jgi:multiple sugar transport system permease protein